MSGPIPKDPKLRQRVNKTATAATLIDSSPLTDGEAPGLPRRNDGESWMPEVAVWWRDVWASPMAGEYTRADVHGLWVLADLIQQYWTAPSSAMAAEIRLQRQCFGLTPIDRRRLQWEIKRVEPERKEKPRPPERVADPRAAIRAVT